MIRSHRNQPMIKPIYETSYSFGKRVCIVDCSHMIKPYNRHSWNVLLAHFWHFLNNRLLHSRQHKQVADNALKKRLDAIAACTREYRALNPHIIGNGAYTSTGICLLNGKPRPARPAINLDTHSNGIPINWGDSGKPGYRVPIKIIVPEQPEHIRYQLEIMEAA